MREFMHLAYDWLMHTSNDHTVRATISLPQSLAEKAKQHDVSLSRFVQETLPEYLKRRDAEAWLERNQAGIEAYNEFVAEHGVLTETLRTF
jgi:post-segregation antitoxin (ccd killing protein)